MVRGAAVDRPGSVIDVRWAPQARRDIDRIDAYYRETDPDFAQRIAAGLFTTTAMLCENPLLGPIAAYGDRRKWRVARTPYLLFYRAAKTHIRVLRVLHDRMDQRTL